MEELFLSVIIPSYNEERNIVSTLSEIAEYLGKKDFSYELILIDDGSEDPTVRSSREFENKISNFQLIESKPNRGKGYVLKKAMMKARGEYVMFMDADNSTSIYELDKFLPYLEEGYDAVIASRRIKGAEVVVPESVLRVLMGNVYILLSRIIFKLRVNDINCGFKAYRRDAARKIFSLQKMNDWSFDTELIFLIHKFGMRVKEVPVKWAHKYTSKVKPFRAGIQSFLSLLKIKLSDLKGDYTVKEG
ncbi:MAG: dolichyl-phosphate beta-glucosyltransferase [Candidatus Omnitrophota bacterium]